MNKYFLLVIYFLAANSYNINTTVRCACNEFPAAICYMQNYCYWAESQCLDLQCSYLYERKCSDPRYSEYKCKWNTQSQQCEEYNYQCSDLNESDCYIHQKESRLDCVWNSQTSQCVKFSCIDQSDCDFSRCSNINQICGEPQNLNCTELLSCDDEQYLGNGQYCLLNDSGVCRAYNIQFTDCAEFNDSKSICNQQYCTYDVKNQLCKQNTCSQLVENNCTLITMNEQVIYCYWDGNSCIEASYDQASEYITSIQSYFCLQLYEFITWDSDSQQCKLCTNLVSYPSYIDNNQLQSIIIKGLLICLYLF